MITYEFLVTNTGNVNLTSITIDDPMLGITQGACANSLVPGETRVCQTTGTYAVTQADVDAGVLINTATATGWSPLGEPITDSTEVVVTGIPLVSIGDLVWSDVNGNGIQDAGEPGMAGVTVGLYDADGNMVAATTTDENGFYSFTDLMVSALYYVEFVVPTGSQFTTANAGTNDALDSDADPATGRVAVTTPQSGMNSAIYPDDPTIDAGLLGLA